MGRHRALRWALPGLLVLAAPLAALAQDNWASAGTLSGRYLHTATLLPNGKVLAVGGYDADARPDRYANVDLYDPVSNSWTAAAALDVARDHHTATLLASGKVLVAGGWGSSGTPKTTQIYDPAADAWTSSADMQAERVAHTATLLPDGKVLVVGGGSGATQSRSSAELYDPASDTWALAASMHVPRIYHSAVLLPNGKVLVAGGEDGGRSAEVYDPVRDRWEPTPDMAVGRVWLTATLLPNGTVLVTGGMMSGAKVSASAEIYDPERNAWTPAPDMSTRRVKQTSTLLANGEVLVTGGSVDGIGVGLVSAERYQPAMAPGLWVPSPPMAAGRGFHTATALLDGRVLVAGGSNTARSPYGVPESERYTLAWLASGATSPTLNTPATTPQLTPGSVLALTGTGLLAAAGPGATQLQLQPLNGGAVTVLPVVNAGATSLSAQALAAAALPAGWYTVRAIVGGVPSNAVVAFSAPPPGAPTGIGTQSGDEQVSVHWAAPADTSAVTGYTVTAYAADDPATPAGSCDAAVDASPLACVVTGLSNGTAYVFVVTANGQGGTSAAPTAAVAPVASVGVLTADLPPGRLGVAYNQSIPVAGGVPGYRFTLVGGQLPDGLSLNADTGAISGVPTRAQIAQFRVRVTDSTLVARDMQAKAGPTLHATEVDLTLAIAAPVPTLDAWALAALLGCVAWLGASFTRRQRMR